MNITILTVDTDYTRTLLNTKLEEQNHRVIADTNNYEEALNLYKSYLPDVIILDIDLGDTDDGLSFLAELLEVDPSAQIIALSTFFKDSTRATLLKNGINRLIMKPYQPAHIWEQIDNICEVNDINSLREAREKRANEGAITRDNQNKGIQLNKQINSLREQILKSRSITEKQSEDFTLDFDPIDTYNKTSGSQGINLSTYKTSYSDNTIEFDISLEDTFNSDSYNKKSNSTTYSTYVSETHDAEDESNSTKGYLGLGVLIDRENRNLEYDENVDNTSPAYESTSETNSNSLLNKILRKKGGK